LRLPKRGEIQNGILPGFSGDFDMAENEHVQGQNRTEAGKNGEFLRSTARGRELVIKARPLRV